MPLWTPLCTRAHSSAWTSARARACVRACVCATEFIWSLTRKLQGMLVSDESSSRLRLINQIKTRLLSSCALENVFYKVSGSPFLLRFRFSVFPSPSSPPPSVCRESLLFLDPHQRKCEEQKGELVHEFTNSSSSEPFLRALPRSFRRRWRGGGELESRKEKQQAVLPPTVYYIFAITFPPNGIFCPV